MEGTGVPIIAEFVGHPRETEWHRVYVDAKKSVEQSRGIEVIDVTELNSTDLDHIREKFMVLFHVIRAAEANRPTTRGQLRNSCDRQVADGRMALGIAPLGKSADEAEEAIFEEFGDAPGSLLRWIEGVTTLDELRKQIVEWLLLILDLWRVSPPYTDESEAVLAAELPSTEEGAAVSKTRRFRSLP